MALVAQVIGNSIPLYSNIQRLALPFPSYAAPIAPRGPLSKPICNPSFKLLEKKLQAIKGGRNAISTAPLEK
jgi:hypothetical protein